MNSETLVNALERRGKKPTVVTGAPEGMDAVILSKLSRQDRDVIFVARDDVSMSAWRRPCGFSIPNCLS